MSPTGSGLAAQCSTSTNIIQPLYAQCHLGVKTGACRSVCQLFVTLAVKAFILATAAQELGHTR